MLPRPSLLSLAAAPGRHSFRSGHRRTAQLRLPPPPSAPVSRRTAVCCAALVQASCSTCWPSCLRWLTSCSSRGVRLLPSTGRRRCAGSASACSSCRRDGRMTAIAAWHEFALALTRPPPSSPSPLPPPTACPTQPASACWSARTTRLRWACTWRSAASGRAPCRLWCCCGPFSTSASRPPARGDGTLSDGPSSVRQTDRQTDTARQRSTAGCSLLLVFSRLRPAVLTAGSLAHRYCVLPWLY